MVYHIVMWNFKKEVAEAKKPELLENMKTNLEALVGVVPGLLSVKYVANPLPTSNLFLVHLIKLGLWLWKSTKNIIENLKDIGD